MEYGSGRRRGLWFTRFLFVVAALALLYDGTYGVLRLTGVYYPFFDQGSWEIEGSTGIDVIDEAFRGGVVGGGFAELAEMAAGTNGRVMGSRQRSRSICNYPYFLPTKGYLLK